MPFSAACLSLPQQPASLSTLSSSVAWLPAPRPAQTRAGEAPVKGFIIRVKKRIVLSPGDHQSYPARGVAPLEGNPPCQLPRFKKLFPEARSELLPSAHAPPAGDDQISITAAGCPGASIPLAIASPGKWPPTTETVYSGDLLTGGGESSARRWLICTASIFSVPDSVR